MSQSKIRIDIIERGVRIAGRGTFQEDQRATADEIAADIHRIVGWPVEIVRVSWMRSEWFETLAVFDDDLTPAETTG